MTEKITAFAGIFEQRLNRLKKDLKQELDKSKNDRQRGRLRSLLKEAKELRNLVKELKPKCPHCGKPL